MKLQNSTLAKMAAAAGGIGVAAVVAAGHLGARLELPTSNPPITTDSLIEVNAPIPEVAPAEVDPIPANPPQHALVDPCPPCGLG